MNKKICLNCKRVISEHTNEELVYCTQNIVKDLIHTDEQRRHMLEKQKNKRS